MKKKLPDFSAGDTIRVHHLIQEGGKERVQIFEGIVLQRNGGGIDESFTVRKISYNVGVERIFPLHSPRIAKIEIKQKGKVRRARLYYLRDLKGKKARIQSEAYTEAPADDVDESPTPEKEESPKKDSKSAKPASAPQEEVQAAS